MDVLLHMAVDIWANQLNHGSVGRSKTWEVFHKSCVLPWIRVGKLESSAKKWATSVKIK